MAGQCEKGSVTGRQACGWVRTHSTASEASSSILEMGLDMAKMMGRSPCSVQPSSIAVTTCSVNRRPAPARPNRMDGRTCNGTGMAAGAAVRVVQKVRTRLVYTSIHSPPLFPPQPLRGRANTRQSTRADGPAYTLPGLSGLRAV
eukprot:365604-Chlamydomonas_euryale.AAC.14